MLRSNTMETDFIETYILTYAFFLQTLKQSENDSNSHSNSYSYVNTKDFFMLRSNVRKYEKNYSNTLT